MSENKALLRRFVGRGGVTTQLPSTMPETQKTAQNTSMN